MRSNLPAWGVRRNPQPPPVQAEDVPLSPSPHGTRPAPATLPVRSVPVLADVGTPAPDEAVRAAAAAEQTALTELALRCQRGDAAAWEQMARTQHRRIYGLCFRFTNSAGEAEDLTQEVFIKVFRNLSSFDPAKGAFGTWITTLTRNLLVDNYRRGKMDRASESLDIAPDGTDDGLTRAERLADGRRTPDQHVAGMELRVHVQAALAQVSPDLREAVILRDLQDMDYKEIAAVLGVPQGTVKSRISRGRAELARLLKRFEGQVI